MYHSLMTSMIVFPLAMATLFLDSDFATAQLIHRYSFGESTGTTVNDSIGGANGEILGSGWTFGGGELTLPGGPSETAPYVDLPNGLISGLSNATVEGWITVDGEQSWQRVFDFGSTEGGELDGPGGGGNGLDYWMLSAARGTEINQQRLELRNLDPAFGGNDAGVVSGEQQILDTDLVTSIGEEYHFAAVYDSTVPELREYRDGELVGSLAVSIELGNINDVNNWLGRSNWVNDANLEGSYNEFRIYDEALDNDSIRTSFVAGPDLETGIADLIAQISGLGLPPGTATSLQAKLHAAHDSVLADNSDRRQNVFNVLAAFTHSVEAQRDKKINGSDADLLIEKATSIITQFGGHNSFDALAAGPGDPNDEQTSLVYNTSTGELNINPPVGTELTSINITSARSMFIGDKPAALDGAFDNFAADNVFKATFGGSFGSISFGNVLPAGISEADVRSDLSAVGSLAGGGDLGEVDLIYIPEPACFLLVIIASIFLATTRRLKNQIG